VVGDVPIRRQSGCVWGITTLPRFKLDRQAREALDRYVGIPQESERKIFGFEFSPRSQIDVPSEFDKRQRLLRHFKCHRCHQRNEERSAPIEEIGRTQWTPFLYRLPFQRTPRLTQATAKFTPEYLVNTMRDGVTGLRPEWYSYRMPAFGQHAETIVQALAEADGDVSDVGKKLSVISPDSAKAAPPEPNLTAQGPELVGFSGYSC